MSYRTQQGRFETIPEAVRNGQERTNAQRDLLLGTVMGLGFLAAAGGKWLTNPMGFPGYEDSHGYWGTYATYRFMLNNPVLRSVRAIAVAPIQASRWKYAKADSSVPDGHVDLVKKNMDRLRASLLADYFVRGRDFGWAGGEPIWEIKKRETEIARVKPLLWDLTEIMQDNQGNFTGLRNYIPLPTSTSPTKGYVDIPYPWKAFKYTYDAEAGYHYGRSWLENSRDTCWKDWLDCLQQLQRIGSKISGIQTIIKSPAGTFTGPNGKQVSWKENGMKAIEAIAKGAAGVWFPTLDLKIDARSNIDVMRVMGELINKSAINIELLDYGSTAPAIKGILERMQHAEELMFHSGLCPPRTGMQSKFGQQSDAEIHTDTATLVRTIDDAGFAEQCQPLVDALLVVNKGENERGTVRIVPMAPTLRDTIRAFLLSLMKDPATTDELLRIIDIDDELLDLGLTLREPLNVDRIQATRAAARPAFTSAGPNDPNDPNKPNPPTTPEPEGGRPPKES